jgi:hypothetical protein
VFPLLPDTGMFAHMESRSHIWRPAEGPDSHDSLDRALLAGFVDPSLELPFGQRKVTARRLRIRVLAAHSWRTNDKSPTHHDLASQLGLSARYIANHFPSRYGLFAFPPPEFAIAKR